MFLGPRHTYGIELCEAHHVGWLSCGGNDILDNRVLICPNHLRATLHALRPGGHLFVGDVRSLPLLPLLHASVERFKSAAALTPTQARERIHTMLAHETELAVAPAFFTTLGERVEGVSRMPRQAHRAVHHLHRLLQRDPVQGPFFHRGILA